MGVINATVCYHMHWTAVLGLLIGGGASATSIDIVAVQEYGIKTRQAEITIRQKTPAFVYYHQSVSHRVFCCCQYYCNYDRRNKFHLLFTAAFARPVTATVVPELITPLRQIPMASRHASTVFSTDYVTSVHLSFVLYGITQPRLLDTRVNKVYRTTREQLPFLRGSWATGTTRATCPDAYSESRICTFMWVSGSGQ